MIICERERHLGMITLARPTALNALNLSMIHTLQQQLTQWEHDPAIHAIVVQSASEKAFCAGGDVRWLYEAGLAGNPEQLSFFWHEYRLNHYISQLSKPYIALLDGMTMGGGVGISLHGSHAIATPRFVFAMPETGIGLFPDVGASYLLARCPGYLGLYLGLTGARLTAADALYAGLVKAVIESERLPEVIPSLHQLDLSVNAHQTIDTYLQHIGITNHTAPIQSVMPPINHYFAADNVPAIMTRLHQDDDWAATTLTTLQQKSPLSLVVTHRAIMQAQQQSLAECLAVDYCLVQHFMADHDFYEGIRAVLIDKDKAPTWQPGCLDEVTPAMLTNYFVLSERSL